MSSFSRDHPVYAGPVGVWETVLAAAGGLVLGFGLGLIIARVRERSLRQRMRHTQSRLRSTVVPVLEARAQALGIPPAERQSFTEDPIELAVGLSASIQRVEGDPNLAFSDTVEVARAEMRRKG